MLPAHVLQNRHGFHMLRIHTSGVAAQVIQLHPIGNYAAMSLKNLAMGVRVYSSNLNSTVSLAIFRSGPQPAPAGVPDEARQIDSATSVVAANEGGGRAFHMAFSSVGALVDRGWKPTATLARYRRAVAEGVGHEMPSGNHNGPLTSLAYISPADSPWSSSSSGYSSSIAASTFARSQSRP